MKFILHELTLIIPTKDDHLRIENNIWDILSYLESKIQQYEVLIVSNNSSKESIEYLDNFSSGTDFVKHISILKKGKGAAVKEGIVKSKYRNILFIDADCSVKIDEFDKFVTQGNLKTPFVIGNRKHNQSRNINSPLIRKITGFIYLKLIQSIFDLTIEDTQCGFKAIDKEKFPTCKNFTTDGFSFDIELILLALKSGLRIEQIPVDYFHDSNSKVNILPQTIRMVLDVYKIKKGKT